MTNPRKMQTCLHDSFGNQQPKLVLVKKVNMSSLGTAKNKELLVMQMPTKRISMNHVFKIMELINVIMMQL